MSDTPRTDAAEYDFYYGHFGVEPDFARELERENAELRLALNVEADAVTSQGRAINQLRAENAELRQEICDQAAFYKAYDQREANLLAKIDELRKDKERLDWLEKRRVALNAHCGSSYGWEVIQSHLVNRLMLRTPEVYAMAAVDLNDVGAGGKDIRHAIDDAMSAASLTGK